MDKKIRREKEEQKKLLAGQQQTPGKRMPKLKITKGRLGQKLKKKGDDDDDMDKGKEKFQAREIRGMEELYWTVKQAKKTLEHMKQQYESDKIYDLFYEAQELYTEPRKRMQIELLREMIFELKRQFNKEFGELEQYKEDQVFLIKEKNDQIRELLTNLKHEEELFEPPTHPLEMPEHIFEVKEDEITVEKYLTKEERAKLEEERRKQEEREKALQGDNVGQRGLKSMMGGTELIIKKDNNPLEAELQREDWMSKPWEEMNEEERQRLKEFEQKEKDFKEKRRKAWEQDLKKAKADIIEIQLRFEERMLTLFKKRMFFEVRIMEQELYIIRLTIMLHDAKETRSDEVKYSAEREATEAALREKQALIDTFHEF